MSGYDFSPLYHASHLAFSPGSTFLATSHIDRIIIRSTNNLAIVRTWHIASLSRSDAKADLRRIDFVQWSDDGGYILAYCRAEGVAWVFGLAQVGSGEDGEVVRIESGGVEALERVEWAKGGREILGWGEHGLKMIIYSLPTGETKAIHNAKGSTNCHSYSPDHRYLAVVEKHSGKDFVGVYDAADQYQLVRHFGLQASDAQSIKWSPCGRFIPVVDSHLSYSLYIHSPIGPTLTHFSHLSPTFSFAVSALSDPSNSATSSTSIHEDPGLGIRHLAWAPGGQYLLLLGWDGKVRILESEGWRCMALLGGSQSNRIGKGVTVWREPEGWVKDTRGRGIVQFDRMTHSLPLPSTSSSNSSSQQSPPQPLSISPSGRHFIFLPPQNSTLVHIYSLLPTPGSLPSIKHKAALVFSRNLRGIKWAGGSRDRVAVICRSTTASRGRDQAGGGAVYLWDEEGSWVDESQDGHEEGLAKGGGVMEGIGIPSGADFHMCDLEFSPDGRTLALQSKGEFCLMYDTDDDVSDVGGDGDHARVKTEGGEDKIWETEGLSFVREEEEDSE